MERPPTNNLPSDSPPIQSDPTVNDIPTMAGEALSLAKAGRSPVPIANGFKIPSVYNPKTGEAREIQWARYQKRRATQEIILDWFHPPQDLMGIGIVCGQIGLNPTLLL